MARISDLTRFIRLNEDKNPPSTISETARTCNQQVDNLGHATLIGDGEPRDDESWPKHPRFDHVGLEREANPEPRENQLRTLARLQRNNSGR